jgi:hypothetical protein
MRQLLERIVRLKIILTCALLVGSGSLLIIVGKQLSGEPGWLGALPVAELGGTLVGAGLLSVWLDSVFQRDKEVSDDLRLREVLSDQAPVMRDAVLQAFAADHEDLRRVATPEMLDQIITNSLALRLNDAQFASEVYSDIRDQAVRAAERWYDASVTIDLALFPSVGQRAHSEDARTSEHPELFSVTVRWEYTVAPAHAERRFVSLSDRAEYAEIAHRAAETSAWFIKPGKGIDVSERWAFELLQFHVDGEPRTIRRSAQKDGQTYSVSIGAELVKEGKPVVVSYVYRTVTTQAGHLLYFDIEQPTRGVDVTLNYEGCGIANVSVIDMLPSLKPARVERSPDAPTPASVRVEFDGWVFPRCGVGFGWTLEGELGRN